MRARHLFIAGLCGFALVAPTAAQESAQTWHDKARELGKAAKLVEADQAYRQAIQRYGADPARQQQLYQCQCDHARLLSQMERYKDAETLLRNTLAKLQAMPRQAALPVLEAKVHAGLGEMYRGMERGTPAVAEYDEAVRILRPLAESTPAAREELADTLTQRALQLMNIARYQDADASYREAVHIWHKRIVEQPKAPEYREKLAQACNGYGILARESGRFVLACDLHRSAIQTIETLHAAFPREPKYWYHLPTLYRNLAAPLEHLSCHAEKSAALRTADRWESKLTAMSDASHSWVREGHKVLGSQQSSDAEEVGDKQADIDAHVQKAEAAARAHPDVPLLRGKWLTAKLLKAMRLASSRWLDQALEVYRHALADAAGMMRDYPEVPSYRRLHASLQCKVGLVNYLRCDDKAGDRLIEDAFVQFRKLAADFPEEPKLARAIDEETANLMMYHLSRGHDQKVIDLLGTSIDGLGKLCAKYPRCPEYRRHHAQALVPLGHTHARLKHDADAEKAFRESLRLWLKVIEDFPEVTEFNLYACQVRSALLQLYHRQERWKDAEALVQEMKQGHEKLIAAIPQLANQHTGLAICHVWQASIAGKQKKLQPALEAYARAIAHCEKAMTACPSERGHLQLMVATLRERSSLHADAGNFAEYDRDLQRSRQWGEWLDSPFVRLTRIVRRVETSDAADWARRDADDLFDCGELTAAQWFDLADIYSRLLKSADAASRERLASRTLTALRKALEDGYRPTTPLREDSRFQMLADRAEFQNLIAARR